MYERLVAHAALCPVLAFNSHTAAVSNPTTRRFALIGWNRTAWTAAPHGIARAHRQPPDASSSSSAAASAATAAPGRGLDHRRTAPSREDVASAPPSSVQSMSVTAAVCPSRDATRSNDADDDDDGDDDDGDDDGALAFALPRSNATSSTTPHSLPTARTRGPILDHRTRDTPDACVCLTAPADLSADARRVDVVVVVLRAPARFQSRVSSSPPPPPPSSFRSPSTDDARDDVGSDGLPGTARPLAASPLVAAASVVVAPFSFARRSIARRNVP